MTQTLIHDRASMLRQQVPLLEQEIRRLSGQMRFLLSQAGEASAEQQALLLGQSKQRRELLRQRMELIHEARREGVAWNTNTSQ